MELRYRGFDQNQNTRMYKFDNVAESEPTVRLVITVDLTLFQKHHVAIQEGPDLCAQKLAADLENPEIQNHELTADDFQAHLSARAAAAAMKQALRRKSARRRHVSKPLHPMPWFRPKGTA